MLEPDAFRGRFEPLLPDGAHSGQWDDSAGRRPCDDDDLEDLEDLGDPQ